MIQLDFSISKFPSTEIYPVEMTCEVKIKKS